MREQGVKLLNMHDVSEKTVWHLETVRKLFDDEDFPGIKIWKENQVEETALKNWLQKRRVTRGR